MSLFNEDNIFNKYTNLKYKSYAENAISSLPASYKIHIKHSYIYIYKIKMSGRPKHCMRKYDK